MFKIDNQSVTRLLSREKLKVNRFRNIVAVIAIALTAILFTMLFTIAGGIMDQLRQTGMRTDGSSSHATIKYLTGKEFEALKQTGGYSELSYTVLVGEVLNPELIKITPELRYGEDSAARQLNSYPTNGHMPKAKNEIAMSTIVLDLLNIPREIGTEVSLQINANQVDYAETFLLSGYWEGDIIAPAQQIWLSKEFTEMAAPVTEIPYEQSFHYSGLICAEVMFSNHYQLDEKLDTLLAEAGLSDSHAGISPYWQTFRMDDLDIFTIIGAVILLGTILLTGYLIIYNIFYISVTQDIQFYGLLKTVGTSAKQLKQIVHLQAFLLSLIGLPLGLVTGTLLGQKLLPFLLELTTAEGVGAFHLSGWVLLFAIVFTLLTVYISCIKPCKMAVSISPVDAVRYTGIRSKDKKSEKDTGSCSPLSMAWENFKRNRKKAVLVILSLTLSLSLLNAVYTGITGFDFDRYIDQYAVADFFVTHYSINSVNTAEKEMNGIDEEFRTELDRLNGVEEILHIYGREDQLYPDTALQGVLQELDYDESGIYFLENNEFPLTCYGIASLPESFFRFTNGSFDDEKWKSGNYVIISGMHIFAAPDIEIYQPGDTILLNDDNGEPQEYTVMAVGQMETLLTTQQQYMYGFDVILPDEEYLHLYEESNPMTTLFNVSDDSREEAEDVIENYCEYENTELTYISRRTYEKEFQQNKTMFILIGGVLSLILGMIGILNFLNAVITSILARKRELAMLGAVGMDGQQMKSMLIYESMIYIVATFLLTATLGLGISWITGELFFSIYWAYRWHFTLTPVILCVPFLFLISAAVPLFYYRNVSKLSIVERLRID